MRLPVDTTTFDLVISGAILVVGALIIVLLVSPADKLKKHLDEERLNEVEDIFQALVEYRAVDPAGYAALQDRAGTGYVMLGAATDCSGSFGSSCADPMLSDTCLDASEALGPYFASIPVDPRKTYSAEHTGYYVILENNFLEVGACNPEGRETIRLRDAQ